jgi:hypothetical protein
MRQKTARTCLIVATILFSLVGLLGILPALTSFFIFDAPGSEKNPATIVLFFSALTLPIVCLLSIATAWVIYARKHFAAACCIALIPVVNLISGGAALLWLEIFNGGHFS